MGKKSAHIKGKGEICLTLLHNCFTTVSLRLVPLIYDKIQRGESWAADKGSGCIPPPITSSS